ncbi:HAD family phosphatase [Flavobacteriaceae bacterium TP-CH-4]|uniref:HAD family phosphatase n=1 Tax=Pelagihabitans pacificus TaxID=2696054 RepID=A0A967EBY1_9FLAO|nr:HAD family hydrolase [Pelagihabitans pacificus]NHF57708.1 HAD family phosphatase [Pelagihabitans pacificus]
MDFSKIKMVVTDMDGTLLNSKHEVSDCFFTLFHELKQRDILFVAASGRQYSSIVDKLRPIQNDIIVIAENGGFVVMEEQELLATPLAHSAKNEILDILGKVPNVHPVLCGKHNAHLMDTDATFIEKLEEYYTKYEVLPDLRAYQGEVLKIAIYHHVSSEKHIYPYVKHLEGDLKVKVSGENWVDISSSNAHKGYALQKVQELHKITPAETMVFGDYNNDLEMLALGEFSFAMANAHPNVKKMANYHTLSNDELGVETILKKLLAS